jgi:hypothetical protein
MTRERSDLNAAEVACGADSADCLVAKRRNRMRPCDG